MNSAQKLITEVSVLAMMPEVSFMNFKMKLVYV